MQAYSLVITSCGRPELLQKTWASFTAHAEQGPRQTIIIDDGDMPRPDWLPRHNTVWINNGVQRGQIFSIDKAYEQVTQPYIFHLEDDWQFVESGFLEKSFEILEQDPSVISVMVRNDQHPIDYAKGWGHFSFNPGLRRLSDYRRLGSYGRHTGYGPNDLDAELRLSKLHRDLGFRLESSPKHCFHIGDTQHVTRSTAQPLPKILIAIPTANVLDYSAFRENQKRMQGEKFVERFPNGMSGLQVDGRNTRQQAVRDTWFKDVAAHPNVSLEFFDGERCGCPDDHMHVVNKGMFAYKYGLEKGYDWVFKCDDDTFVFVDRLVRKVMELPKTIERDNGWGQLEKHDIHYAGLGQCDFGWGGVGYLIDRHALAFMTSLPVPDSPDLSWREDYWTGQLLWSQGIRLHELSSQLQVNYDRPVHPPFSVHPVSPERMIELYEHPESLSY
jgi:hypothetical protein